jgi:DNA-directed RNA polymerase specialized sigma24 family protein
MDMHDCGHPLLEPGLQRHLRRVLARRRIPPEWLDDEVDEVVVRTLEALPPGAPPADADEWQALATTVAVNYAADERKKARRRERLGNAGLCEDADGFEPLLDDTWRHWLDAKRLALVLADLFARGEMPGHGWAILEAVVCDEATKAIAEELELSNEAVRGRLKRMRKRFCERVEEQGLSHLRLRTKDAEGGDE